MCTISTELYQTGSLIYYLCAPDTMTLYTRLMLLVSRYLFLCKCAYLRKQLHIIYILHHTLLTIVHTCAPFWQLKKQSHLFIEPEVVWQVEFDYAITVLKESLKGYNITRAKLVINPTHRFNRA
jgi:hypothetical protein